MKDGFIKAAAASVKIKVADVEYNKVQIVDAINNAQQQGIRLLVLPELCITGYTCGDLFIQPVLLNAAEAALSYILDRTADTDVVVVLGLPVLLRDKLYNCAAVVHGGKLLGIVPKSHLPMYGEFYEGRHFTPAPEQIATVNLCGSSVPFGTDLIFAAENLPDFRLAVEICEDLWSYNPPSTRHAASGATVIANPSASNETIGKAAYRRALLETASARLLCAYVYAGSADGESTGDLVFGGHNLIAENGTLLAESDAFAYAPAVCEIDLQRLIGERRRMNTFPAKASDTHTLVPFSFRTIDETTLTRHIPALPFVPQEETSLGERCALILTMQAQGLRKRIEHTNARSLVVGLSGGLDSTLALLVMVEAMKRCGRDLQDIIAVTMPCFGTTKRTKSNAALLSQSLGVRLLEINITDAVRQHFADIGQAEEDHSVTFENAQARERTQVLMDIANKNGGLVVGTGDLSELALGWATYNGDHMSMYGVNASVPKTLIRHIVRYCADTTDNPTLRTTLLDILDTPVSPELLPAKDGEIAQKTEDLVGPYDLHDFFLYYSIRWGFSPKKVFRLAMYAHAEHYDRETILKWLKIFYRRFFNQQFKRSCLPDGPKIGSVSLSPRGDWRMPSDACAALWLKELDELDRP